MAKAAVKDVDVSELPVVQEVANAQLDRLMPNETVTLRTMLEGMNALLEDPAHWTTGALAKDAKGSSCSPIDPKATCWCAIGATYKVYHDLTGVDGQTSKAQLMVLKITQRLLQSASQMLIGTRVENANDNTHGRENLLRMVPLALSIVEYATENVQDALGAPVGAIDVVDPSVNPELHAQVSDMLSQNEPPVGFPLPDDKPASEPPVVLPGAEHIPDAQEENPAN